MNNQTTTTLATPCGFRKPFFFLSANADQCITHASESVQQVLGVQAGAVIGLDWRDLIVVDDNLYQRAAAGPPEFIQPNENYRDSLQAVKSSRGQTRIIRASARAKRDGINACGSVNFHLLGQDVTDAYHVDQCLFNSFSEVGFGSAPLSERERYVLKLVMEGRVNKSIAQEIGITERGVERVRARLLSKFNVGTSAQLVRKATISQLFDELMILTGKGTEESYDNQYAVSILFPSLLRPLE